MLISEIPEAEKICEIVYIDKVYKGKKTPYFDKRIAGQWETRDLYKRRGFVYFITFDDVIIKIGQSSNMQGYMGLVRSYMNAGMGDTPGEGRFVSACQIREAMADNIKVAFHAIAVKDVSYVLQCPFTGETHIESAPPNMQIFERFYINKYMEKMSVAPMMNYPNNNQSHSPKHVEAFRAYHTANSSYRKK